MTTTRHDRSVRQAYGWIIATSLLLAASAAQACGPNPGGCPGTAGVGNPINVMTGNKYQQEVDLPALPGVMGLEIVRHYNSASSKLSDAPGIVGRGWKLSYETALRVSGHNLEIAEADGTLHTFNCDLLTPDTCESDDHTEGRIQVIRAAQPRDKAYLLTDNEGRKQRFNARGKLMQIEAPTGEFVSLQYDARDLLVKVTDPQGRVMQLHYLDRHTAQAGDRFQGVQSIDTPVGRFGYAYGSALPAGATANKSATLANLVRVDLPATATGVTGDKPVALGATTSNHARLYHYENALRPTYLTGISLLDASAIVDPGKSATRTQPVTQRYATFGYDIDGKAILSTHANGVDKVTLDFSLGGQTRVTNSLGQQTLYRYTILAGEYRLLEVRGAGCALCGESNVRYGYDRLGRRTEVTHLDAQGAPLVTITTALDYYGRPLTIDRIAYVGGKSEPAQHQVRYEYGEATLSVPTLIARPSVVPGKEHQIRIDYNPLGQPLRVAESGFDPVVENGKINADTSVATKRLISYRYQKINGKSLLAEIYGPLKGGINSGAADSDITRFTWDKTGSVVEQITYPAGRIARYEYERDAFNAPTRLSRSIGVDGVPTDLHYDPLGALVEVNRAGSITRYRHDGLGHTTGVMSPDGQQLHFGFDGNQQLASIFDQQNNRIQLTRNTEGALVEAKLLNPNGTAAQQPLRFQNPSEATHTESPSGSPVEPSRDAVLAAVRQLIEATQGGNDNVARPELSAAPYAALQAFMVAANSAAEAAPRSAISQAADAAGALTTYVTNDFGKLIQVQSPTTGTTSYRYDLAGRIVGRINADGSSVDYARDAAGRVTTIEARDTKSQIDEHASVQWGKADKPVLISYLAGEERFEYDAGARLTVHTQTIDKQRFTLRYRYDSAGKLIEKTLPGGQTLSYRYRGANHPRAGLLESIWLERFDNATANRLSRGMLARPIVRNMNDVSDRYAQRTFAFGNGLTNSITLDAQGRVVEAGNALVGQTQLQYGDHADRNLRLDDPAAISTENSIAKQTADQPYGDQVSGAYPNDVRTLQPVLLGQRAQEQAAQAFIARLRSATTQWSNLPAYEQPAAFGINDNAATHANLFDPKFDQQGRQTSAGTARYRYDSLHRLIGIDRAATDGATHEVARYRYNVFGQRIAKTVVLADGKSKKTTHYFYDGSQLVFEDGNLDASQLLAGKNNGKQYIWLNDKPVAMLVAEQILAIHTDHRNAPLALTDEARRVVWQAKVANFLQASPAQGKTLGTVNFNLRGSNQYFDEESDLHYNTNRYYDPVAARYLTPDPMGLAVGPDLYAFALNRPHDMGDPLALAPVPNQDISDWSFAEKLVKTVSLVLPRLPSDIGAVLLDMVSTDKIATTAAIFALWAGSHAFGIGFAFDAVMLGVAYYTLGKAAADLVIGLINTTIAINSAKCLSDLDNAASVLSRALCKGVGGFVEGALLRRVFSKTEGDLGATAIEKLKQGINYGRNKIINASSTASKLGFRASAWAATISTAERGFMGELDAWSWLISGKAKLQALCCKTLRPDLIKNSADYQRELSGYTGTTGTDGIFQSAPGFFKRLIGNKPEFFVVESKAKGGSYRYTRGELNGLLKDTNTGQQMSDAWLGNAERIGSRLFNRLLKYPRACQRIALLKR